MSKFTITKKRVILISVFLTLFIIGTVLIITIPIDIKLTYGKTVKTNDGITITFNVFEPKNSDSDKKAIILGHGIMSNKEMLKDYAIEFATAGFVAVTFDFRGHGQSFGDLDSGSLISDIEAIISYLDSRSDIDMNNLAYLGYSLGGVGMQIVNKSTAFKCYIGAATWFPKNIRKGNSTMPLNILMIVGRYDELITLEYLKEGLSDYTGITARDLDVNKLYGSFENGNASMIYFDDFTNHLLGNYDPELIKEARIFLANTFPNVRPVDENFIVNARLFIFSFQLLGGFGFFVLIIDPLSNLLLKKPEGDLFKLDLEEQSVIRVGVKSCAFSLILGLFGVVIFIPVLLISFLATAGFIMALLFGQAFGFLVLIWKMGKKRNIQMSDIIKKPFKTSRENITRHFLLGMILAILLTLIIYLSGGLNYIGMIPSLVKIPWVLLFLVINFIIFMIYGLLFHGILQNKFEQGFKSLVEVSLMIFGLLFAYWFVYLFTIALITGSFFYFGTFLPIAIPLFLLMAFLSTHIYQKTGNIIAGALVNTIFFTLLICTISPYQNGLSFILGFLY